MNTTLTKFRLLAVLAAGALALTGCSTSPATQENDTAAATTLTASDMWVKAADSGMTAAFGMLENLTDHGITIVSVSTSVSDMTELHETLENDSGEMVMQEIDGGFVIPAGGTFLLEPGANHIMIMGVTQAIAAGDTITVTLTLDDGSTIELEAPAKDYSGANENYEEGDMDTDHGDMKMDE